MTKSGDRLVAQLLVDPLSFKEEGLSYQLLLEVFAGHPLNEIRRLLRNDDLLVQHAAIFVASEVGSESVKLLEELIAAARSIDGYIRYNALEAIAVATGIERQEEFAHVLLALNDSDEGIRRMAMRVASRVSPTRLLASERGLRRITMEADELGEHLEGLELLNNRDQWQEAAKPYLFSDTSPLLRRYAAIAFKRGGVSDKMGSTVKDEDVLDLWKSS